METGLIAIEIAARIHSVPMDVQSIRKKYFVERELSPEEMIRILQDHGFKAKHRKLSSLEELRGYLDGFTKGEIVFSRSGDDLLVLTSANDSIQCKYNLLASYQYTSTQTGTFTDASPGIERVETSDGYYITRADIINIVNAMVDYNISDNMTTSAQYTNFMGNTNYQAMLAQGWHQITNP
jgi:hypothetical protein